MVLRRETVVLQNPAIAALPQVSDQLSFLYLTDAKVVQDATGIVALSDQDGRQLRTSIPIATVAALLLGHGTSITQPALTTISKHGTSILWVGADGSRTHGWSYALTSSARWIEAQAALWADPPARRQVAVAMYQQRFGADLDTSDMTLTQLRGLEGHRMKQLYQDHARRHGIRFKRSYQPDDYTASDPVNQALSTANAALYGVVSASIVALGCHPGLGFIHAGNISSFVFDIADLYKADISIPAAFTAANQSNPTRAALKLARQAMVEHRILARAVTDIQTLLQPRLRSASPSESLLRADDGFVAGGVQHQPTEPT